MVPPVLLVGGERPSRSPRCHVTARGDREGLSPGTLPCQLGLHQPNTGDQQRGPLGVPVPPAPGPHHLPSERPPAACKRRAGLEGAAGTSGTKREPPGTGTGHGDADLILHSGFKPGIRSPKSRTPPVLVCWWILARRTPNPFRRRAGGTAQPRQGLSPLCGHWGVVLCPRTSAGEVFWGAGLRLPAESLSELGVQRGREQGDRARGARGARGHAVPDCELPHFGGALRGGRGVALAQVLQRLLRALALVRAWAAVLGALHVVPGGPWGHRDG